MEDRTSKRILVTGASRGVGRQIALALAKQGYQPMLHGRTRAACQGVVDELQELGIATQSFGAELSEPNQVSRMIHEIVSRFGGLDILYNNAAIMTPWRSPHTTPTEDFRLSFEVNVIALATLCDAFLPGMVERGWGRIVNVTSGIEYIRELLPYSMSKAAVDRYVRDVSPSLVGTGVVMSLMDPGWLKTDLGGAEAPNEVETCIPGALVPLFVADDTTSGRLYAAQDYRE